MGVILREVKDKPKKPLGWYEFDIKKLQRVGKTLHIFDSRTSGEAIISKGYEGVYMFFYLRPGDRITVQGYVTKRGSLHCTGGLGFRDPQPADLEERENEAQAKLDEWYDDDGNL